MSASTLTLHVLSDSIGETADTVSRILDVQFPQLDCDFEFATMIDSIAALHEAVLPYSGDPRHIFVYTLTCRELLDEMRRLCAEEGVSGIDIIGSAIDEFTTLTGEQPSGAVGMLRQVDSAYFRRIAAMEYAVRHDDGQLPESLLEADVVLVGVSRTSKTPLSMYLAHRGYRTANLPLALGIEPPRELFTIDPRCIFGLISSVETIVSVRTERMNEMGSYIPGYADVGRIREEFVAARSLMRRLGCLIINTDGRAIESIAQEIMGHLRNSS